MRNCPTLRLLAIALLLVACAPAPRATIWLGGDVFLGKGGHGALAGIRELASGAGVVNLEGPVGAPGGAGGRPLRLLHAEAALAELRQVGVVVAGIANNHAADAGPGGAAATTAALARAGITAAGVAVVRVGGLRVVVTAHDLGAGVPARLRDELLAARRRGDVLVATFHVTGPPSYLPRPELEAAVAVALDAGALVVAAHGTHVIARVERRERAVIAWGLGNLAFDCACTDEETGVIVEVTLDARGVAGATVIPIDAGLVGGRTRAAADPGLTFELLESLGSSPLTRRADRAAF